MRLTPQQDDILQDLYNKKIIKDLEIYTLQLKMDDILNEIDVLVDETKSLDTEITQFKEHLLYGDYADD